MPADYFIRELELENQRDSLKLHQKLIGDVNCIVWDASIVLAKYLEKRYLTNPEYLIEKNVLELGSGVGCCGLMAAALGAKSILTDLPIALPIIQHNINENASLIRENNGDAQATTLTWGEEFNQLQQPDIILIADCIYYQESVLPLIDTLKQLAGLNTDILQAQELRDSEKQKSVWKFYLNQLRNDFLVKEIDINEQHDEFASDDIKLYRIRKKQR